MKLELNATAELIEAIAAQAVELVLERLDDVAGAASGPYCTPEEAAEYLRCKVQRIYDLRSSGRLTSMREGGRALILRSELDAQVVVDGVRLASSRRAA